jgi:hypothetical protein
MAGTGLALATIEIRADAAAGYAQLTKDRQAARPADATGLLLSHPPIKRRLGGRATDTRTAGVRHLSAAYELGVETQFTALRYFAWMAPTTPPQRAGQHDPPVHHLAQQPRPRPTAPPHRRPGKRSLIRHGTPWPRRCCRGIAGVCPAVPGSPV